MVNTLQKSGMLRFLDDRSRLLYVAMTRAKGEYGKDMEDNKDVLIWNGYISISLLYTCSRTIQLGQHEQNQYHHLFGEVARGCLCTQDTGLE